MEWTILVVAVAIIVLIMIAIVTYKKRKIGCIRIDSSESTREPYIFLELHKDLDFVSSKKYVVLAVKNENYVDTESATRI